MTTDRGGTPAWLTSVEMLGTTAVVLMIGGMVLWYTAAVREPRLVLTIGSGLFIYVVCLVAFGRRSAPHIAMWPFALAGLCAGVIAELVNAQFLMTRESAAAGLTGVVIGTAQWAALRTWLRLTRSAAV
jgi:hypothetical protein